MQSSDKLVAYCLLSVQLFSLKYESKHLGQHFQACFDRELNAVNFLSIFFSWTLNFAIFRLKIILGTFHPPGVVLSGYQRATWSIMEVHPVINMCTKFQVPNAKCRVKLLIASTVCVYPWTCFSGILSGVHIMLKTYSSVDSCVRILLLYFFSPDFAVCAHARLIWVAVTAFCTVPLGRSSSCIRLIRTSNGKLLAARAS